MNTKVTQEGMKLLFSNRLNDCMGKEEITQEKLSKKVGISRPNIAKYLSARSLPGAYKLNRIANFFGVSCDYLIGREDGTNHDDDYIMEQTGLSEAAITQLKKYKLGESSSDDEKMILCGINRLLESKEATDFLLTFSRYIGHPNLKKGELSDEYYEQQYFWYNHLITQLPKCHAEGDMDKIGIDEILYHQVQSLFQQLLTTFRNDENYKKEFIKDFEHRHRKQNMILKQSFESPEDIGIHNLEFYSERE